MTSGSQQHVAISHASKISLRVSLSGSNARVHLEVDRASCDVTVTMHGLGPLPS
jgi:hypothetical protein